MTYFSKNKFWDLLLPLGLFAGSAAIFGSHLHRAIFPGTTDLFNMGLFLAGVAMVCGVFAGLITSILARSLKAGLWIFYTVTLGLWVFMVAGAAVASVGNRPILQVAADEASKGGCGPGPGFEDTLTMLGGSLVGFCFGLWWGVARGIANLRAVLGGDR
jgi:hypothetical protein